MPRSEFDFTVKFFHPPQRTVPFRNGLLDTRTKHTIAQDRFVVAEQRLLAAERRKSVNTLQLLNHEQKRLEKRLASLRDDLTSTFDDGPLKPRGRSTSEVIFRNIQRTSSWSGTLGLHRPKLSVSLYSSNHNLLALPKFDSFDRRSSASSDGATTDNTYSTSDMDSGEEMSIKTRRKKSKSDRKTNKSKRKPTRQIKLPKVASQSSKPLLPIVAVIPPDEDALFLVQ